MLVRVFQWYRADRALQVSSPARVRIAIAVIASVLVWTMGASSTYRVASAAAPAAGVISLTANDPAVLSTPSAQTVLDVAARLAGSNYLPEGTSPLVATDIQIVPMETALAISRTLAPDVSLGRPSREVVVTGGQAIVFDGYFNRAAGQLISMMSIVPSVPGGPGETLRSLTVTTTTMQPDGTMSVEWSSSRSSAPSTSRSVTPAAGTCKDVACIVGAGGGGVGGGITCVVLLPTIALGIACVLIVASALIFGGLICTALLKDDCTLDKAGGAAVPTVSIEANCQLAATGPHHKACGADGTWSDLGYTLLGATFVIEWQPTPTTVWETSPCEESYTSQYYSNTCDVWQWNKPAASSSPWHHVYHAENISTQDDCNASWTARVDLTFSYHRNTDGAGVSVSGLTQAAVSCH